MKTSLPRTFSSTRTNVLPSENLKASHLPTATPRWSQIFLVNCLLALPGKISMVRALAVFWCPADDAGAELHLPTGLKLCARQRLGKGDRICQCG